MLNGITLDASAVAPGGAGGGLPWPMAAALIEPGVEFGPCLVWAVDPSDGQERWLMGGWSGENWIYDEGLILNPTGWHPLPQPPHWVPTFAEVRT